MQLISTQMEKSVYGFQGQSHPGLHSMPFLVTTFTIGWHLMMLQGLQPFTQDDYLKDKFKNQEPGSRNVQEVFINNLT